MQNQHPKIMNKKIQKIECPACQNPIYFDIEQLLLGNTFTCKNCQASISLSRESAPTVSDAMNKLNQIKPLKP